MGTPKRILCAVPGYETYWIERVNPVSFRLWNEWKKADLDQTYRLLTELLIGWNFPKTENPEQPARQPSEGLVALEDLDLHLIPWLSHAITTSLLEEFSLDPSLLTPLPTSPAVA